MNVIFFVKINISRLPSKSNMRCIVSEVSPYLIKYIVKFSEEIKHIDEMIIMFAMLKQTCHTLYRNVESKTLILSFYRE